MFVFHIFYGIQFSANECFKSNKSPLQHIQEYFVTSTDLTMKIEYTLSSN